jgi:uncharacterized protein
MTTKLFIFFGLIASGKSTLASAWAEDKQLPYFNSDIIRKELAGIRPEQSAKDSLNQGIYTPEFSRKTYDKLLKNANKTLKDISTVLDGSYHVAAEREKIITLGQQLTIDPVFILCYCSDSETEKRLGQRALDPQAVSDGTLEIYKKQKLKFEPPVELQKNQILKIETNRSIPDLIKILDQKIN